MFESKGIFVTGTDTGIGKTFVSCAIIQAMQQSGKSVAAMKPVASGCEMLQGQWQNDDALALMQVCDSSLDYALVNPYALPLATAPQIAARVAGIELNPAIVLSAFHAVQAKAEFVVVEGVGGWLAPLSENLDQADLVAAMQLPVLLVVGMRLGCINHARLTEQAIVADGLQLLGWVANYCEPDFDRDGAYLKALSASLNSKCLAKMDFNGQLLIAHAHVQQS